MNNPFFQYFVAVTVFSLMFAKGINSSVQELTSLWRQPALLLSSLLAVVVLVPLVVFVLLWLLDLPPAVATGLAILAAAPGAPMMTKRTEAAGGERTYAVSLQLTLALLAVIVTPLTLAVFYARFELLTERVSPFDVALQVGWVTFLPVIIGLLIGRYLPTIAERIGKPSRAFANIAFVLFMLAVVGLLVFSPELRAMLGIGTWPIAAIVIMVAAALAIGHFLGGPRQESRAVLAVACIARNAGLAFFIAGLSDQGQQAMPTLLTYVILGAVLAIPYAVWSKRQLQSTT